MLCPCGSTLFTFTVSWKKPTPSNGVWGNSWVIGMSKETEIWNSKGKSFQGIKSEQLKKLKGGCFREKIPANRLECVRMLTAVCRFCTRRAQTGCFVTWRCLLHPRYQHSIYHIREASMGGEAWLRVWYEGDGWRLGTAWLLWTTSSASRRFNWRDKEGVSRDTFMCVISGSVAPCMLSGVLLNKTGMGARKECMVYSIHMHVDNNYCGSCNSLLGNFSCALFRCYTEWSKFACFLGDQPVVIIFCIWCVKWFYQCDGVIQCAEYFKYTFTIYVTRADSGYQSPRLLK